MNRAYISIFLTLLPNIIAYSNPTDDRQDTFTQIFTSHFWSQPQNGYVGKEETVSGYGSKLESTIVIRNVLPQLFKQLNIAVFLDLPCGDFNWMKTVNLDNVSYIGADIVPALIAQNQKAYGNATRKFVHIDAVKDVIPQSQLILCRDCLVHLSIPDIKSAIKNFKKSGALYLLTTTYPKALKSNHDIKTGDWRPLNLELPPFNFAKPLLMIDEQSNWGDDQRYGKSLGLWRLADLNID